MTGADFRRIALSLPGAVEGAHMGNADFRVGGKIFATLAYEKQGYGTLMLTPEEQAGMVADEPGIFSAVNGGWGRRGATKVDLKRVKADVLEAALRAAWGRKKPAGGPAAGRGARPTKRIILGGVVVAAGLMGGTASGTLVVNGHVVPLKYAYAIATAEANVRLVVCDVPMSEKELRDDFGLFELKSAGKINAIEVNVPNNSYSIWSKLSEGSISGSGNVEVFKASAKTADRIEGSMEVAASKVGETTYEFHFTAATEILKRAVQARPTADDAAAAATKEQTRIYLAYVRAIQAGNKAALQRVLIPENAQKVDSPDFPQMIKMVQSMTPKQIKVWKVVESGGEATLTVSGMEEGKQVWGSVNLVNIDGRWLIAKERWGGK